MRFCVSGDFLRVGAIPAVPGTPDNLGLGQAARLGDVCAHMPGNLPLWCVGGGPRRHVSACGILAWGVGAEGLG